SLGRAEPHLDEPDGRHGGEISLIHWRPLSIEGSRLACARRPPGRVEPASTNVRWLASLSVAVVAECGARRRNQGRVGTLECRDGKQRDQRDRGEEFLHDTSP